MLSFSIISWPRPTMNRPLPFEPQALTARQRTGPSGRSAESVIRASTSRGSPGSFRELLGANQYGGSGTRTGPGGPNGSIRTRESCETKRTSGVQSVPDNRTVKVLPAAAPAGNACPEVGTLWATAEPATQAESASINMRIGNTLRAISRPATNR